MYTYFKSALTSLEVGVDACDVYAIEACIIKKGKERIFCTMILYFKDEQYHRVPVQENIREVGAKIDAANLMVTNNTHSFSHASIN